MTFNEVLGLVEVLEGLGFKVSEKGFSYKAGSCVWHKYVDIRISADCAKAYVSYDTYSWDGDETEVASQGSYSLPIERLIPTLKKELGFKSKAEKK